MTKHLFLIAFFLIGTALNCQTIDDWVSIASIANVHKKEKKHLDEMQLKQATLVAPTAALSISGALAIKTEQRLHKGIALVYDLIDNAEVIALIVKHSKDIIYTQDKILDFVSDKPEIAPIAAYFEVHYLRESSKEMVKLILAIKESRFNLMDNKQRLDMLYQAAANLKIIRDQCYKLYPFVEFLYHMELYEIDLTPIIIDLNEIIPEIEIEILSITNL